MGYNVLYYYRAKIRYGDLKFFESKGFTIITGQDCSTWISELDGIMPTGYNEVGEIYEDASELTKQLFKEMLEKEIILIEPVNARRTRKEKLF